VHGELYKLQDPAEALKVIDKLEGIKVSSFVRLWKSGEAPKNCLLGPTFTTNRSQTPSVSPAGITSKGALEPLTKLRFGRSEFICQSRPLVAGF